MIPKAAFEADFHRAVDRPGSIRFPDLLSGTGRPTPEKLFSEYSDKSVLLSALGSTEPCLEGQEYFR
jgi:hypothetical protein